MGRGRVKGGLGKLDRVWEGVNRWRSRGKVLAE